MKQLQSSGSCQSSGCQSGCQILAAALHLPGVSRLLKGRTLKTSEKRLLFTSLFVWMGHFAEPCIQSLLVLVGFALVSLWGLLFSPFRLFTFCAFLLSFPYVMAYAYHVGRGTSLDAATTHHEQNVKGKTIVITGANAGMGKACLMQFVKWGAGKVIIGCRNETFAQVAVKEAQQLAETLKTGTEIWSYRLDLSDLSSVREFAKNVTENTKELHTLLNNAGVMVPPYTKTKQGLELQFATNHLGHFLLTKELLPLLKSTGREDAPSRVVSLSSMAHLTNSVVTFKGERFHAGNIEEYIRNPDLMKEWNWTLYGFSKMCNIWMIKKLQEMLDVEGCKTVKCYSAHPGGVRTELQRHTHSARAEWMTKYVVMPLGKIICKTPIEGAQTALMLCSAPTSHLKEGAYFADCKESFSTMEAQDIDCRNKLWTLSEKLIEEAA